jgi:hypothetical protein
VTERAKLYLLPILILLVLSCLACGRSSTGSPAAGTTLTPLYNQETGRLEQLTSDRNNDAKIDTWAYMNGGRLERVEIDRDADGNPDRIEFYETRPAGPGERNSDLERAVITRAEESSGSGDQIVVVRREFFEEGVLQRVEEDTNGDGVPNRWETYEGGSLTRMDLDPRGEGFVSRRLHYGRRGIERIEDDPDGDGVFTPREVAATP